MMLHREAEFISRMLPSTNGSCTTSSAESATRTWLGCSRPAAQPVA
ncbi:UNVERIFIED_ORG: hypothetical protein ABIB19_002472 [Arthrobacter sp. UYEF10]